ncbi:MAG: HEAT repeat domain-containing protein [Sphingobacteriales bacterium]|nr:MAG: HEAT repeat domain-containing protein [Sphingobacteriales bacterium]
MKVPYEKSISELFRMTKEKPPVCWTAYTALAYNDSHEAIETLAHLLANKDWQHVRCAIEAIGKNINGIRLEDELIKFLDSQAIPIVTTSIRALSNLKSKKAHGLIRALTNTDNTSLRQVAIECLSGAWESSDFEFLLSLAKRPNESNMHKIIATVLAEQIDESNWTLFFEQYHNDIIPRHREWSLLSACQFGHDISLINQFVRDKDGHIRKRAQQFIDRTKCA